MTSKQRDDCLAHLAAAEAIMEAAGDLAGLSRLSLVIDRLREDGGLPEREIAGFAADMKGNVSTKGMPWAAPFDLGEHGRSD